MLMILFVHYICIKSKNEKHLFLRWMHSEFGMQELPFSVVMAFLFEIELRIDLRFKYRMRGRWSHGSFQELELEDVERLKAATKVQRDNDYAQCVWYL